MNVIVNPYHRSVTIDGVEVIQEVIPFPDALNHLSSITCTYDETSKMITDVANVHRYVNHFIEKEYYYKNLPKFIDWFYAEQQAQAEADKKAEELIEEAKAAAEEAKETAEQAKKFAEEANETIENATQNLVSAGGSIPVQASGTTTARRLAERFKDIINVKDYGVIGDGVANDTEAFTAFEMRVKDTVVDLHGYTYYVDAEPTGNIYVNGTFLLKETTDEGEAEILIDKPKRHEILATGSTTPRSIYDRFADVINVKDFGAVGDGVTDDTEAIQAAATAYPDSFINMSGATLLTTQLPDRGRFFNGFFLYENKIFEPGYTLIRAGDFGVAAGINAAKSVDIHRQVADLIAFGKGAAQNITTGRNNIAIGDFALQNAKGGRHNIAIGAQSLYFLESDDGSGNDFNGTRNIAIGGNTGHFITSGNRNVMIGRDTGHAITTGYKNIVIGNAALLGDSPNSLKEGVVILQTPIEGYNNVIIGTEAAQYQNGNGAVIIGSNSGQNLKNGIGLILIGEKAGLNLDSEISPFGTHMTSISLSGTYSQQGNETITITSSASLNIAVGYKVRLRFTDGELGRVSAYDDIWFDITSVVSNTVFTISTDQIRTASGNIFISYIADSNTDNIQSLDIVFIGRAAGENVKSISRATVVGSRAGTQCGARSTYIGAISGNTATAVDSVAVGASTLPVTSGAGNVAVGSLAGNLVTSGANNVAIGYLSLGKMTTGEFNVGIGALSLNYDLDGGDFNYSNCIGIGPYTRTSGDSQVQIGNSEQTPYAYSALQIRSDERDKTDIQDCHLGLEFINAIRPVDYRWDFRDDYVRQVEIGKDTEGNPIYDCVKIEKDGSYKRKRLHHGFIAQDIKNVMDKYGVSFGGYQDHTINGGADVLTIGYTELIAPLCKAIQELSAKVKKLEEEKQS